MFYNFQPLNDGTIMRTLCLTFALAILGVVSCQSTNAAEWKAGASRVNITPEKLMWMSGYGSRTSPAEGKVLDLWAKALVLEDPSGERVILITLDLVGIPRDVSLAVRDGIEKKHGLGCKSVALNCSHTHCGPVVGHNLRSMWELDADQQKLIDEYTTKLESQLVDLAGDAIRQLKPARIAWGQSQTTFAVNRRANKEPEVPELKASGVLKGPNDFDVPVVSVRDSDGKLLAVAFGYACHATVMSYNFWSGDYPGFATKYLEDAHPGSVALFWAGCGADQNPLPRRKQELAEQYGRQLADAVEKKLVDKDLRPLAGAITAKYAEIDLAFDALPTRAQLASDLQGTNKFVARRAKALLKDLDSKGLASSYPYPVQVWQLGPDLRWITLGGEVVVDYAVRLKQELGAQTTFVSGYTNDVMAYIPSRRVLLEGGYEGGGAMVYYGLPTVWSTEVEETIVRKVHELAK